MSLDDVTSEFSEPLFVFSSSGSSDSESFLKEDIKKCGNYLNRQWEAIERTLYQEEGQQVTDPELLKECNLWRETFPHFRVKGTKIESTEEEGPKEDEEGPKEDEDKTVQTVEKHLNLSKVNEKREIIKNKVVDQIVGRLIAKFSQGYPYPGARINTTSKSKVKVNQKESYYERGKNESIAKEEMEKNLSKIFEEWEEKKIKTPEKIGKLKPVETTIARKKPERRASTSNALGNIAKPFEMTKKIDKKYEGMLEKIMERKQYEQDIKNYQKTLQRLRLNTGYDNSYRRYPPILNKLSNPWLDRGASNCYFHEKESKNKWMRPSSKDDSDDEIDEKFIEELKRCSYKRPPNRTGVIGEVSMARPRPFMSTESNEKTQKSFSCGDLPKRNVKHLKSKPQKNNMDVQSKAKVKSSSLANVKKNKEVGSKKGLLPPIETGIICKELTGRPKIGFKQPSKR